MPSTSFTMCILLQPGAGPPVETLLKKIEDYEDIERLEEIEYSPAVTFPFLTYEGADPSIDFPEPVYEHEEEHAVCKLGVDVNDLFQHLKNGVLSARGFFEKNR